MSQTQTIQKTYIWDPTTKQATRPLAMFNSNSKILRDARLSDANFRDARFDVMFDNTQNIHYYTHDANKNVTELISDSGAISAHYEYSPFGATIASSGDLSYSNPFQFSSEFSDRPLGLIYYNYRHYNSLDGRWISRDPIEEKGGWNLYGMIGNNSINFIDEYGLKISIGARNVGYPFGWTISNHHFLVITPDDPDAVNACCPGLWANVTLTNLNGQLGFTIGGFDVNGTLTVQTNEEKDVESVNEIPGGIFDPDWDYESHDVGLPEGECEAKTICNLLQAANNYSNNPLAYEKTGNNCTNWAQSILTALGLTGDFDFGGFDWTGGTPIAPEIFTNPFIPYP